MLRYVIAAVVGYLFGSVSVAVLLSRFFYHEDVRNSGSGNAGATNVARVYGFKAGIITLLGDMCKTFAAAGVGYLLAGGAGMLAAATGAMVGHCFPVFFKFRGGKGISVGAAFAIVLDWRCFVIILLTFIVGVALTKKVSVGSVSAAVMLPVSALLLGISGWRLGVAVLVAALAVFMHRENIRRLLRGEEKNFQAKKKE